MKLRTSLLSTLLILGLAATAPAATHTVTQTGLTFVPASLTIETGDTVEWVWTGGFHTVTNGLSPSAPDVGTLFDETLSSGATLVTYMFDTNGVYPYFCRPHFGLGMTGVITVEDPVAAEAAAWGEIKSLYR
jgi:plastocyanin